jgi:hypothetical protein
VGVAATYCIDYHVVSFEPSTVVGALAHRAVPTMTGYHVTIPWTEPRYSQQLLALAITYSITEPAISPSRPLFLGTTNFCYYSSISSLLT